MTPDCLAHSLTQEERTQFEQQGFLVVPGALPSARVDRLTAAVDQLHAQALKAGEAEPNKRWGSTNILGQDESFLGLVDWPTTLPKVWGILGWNIYSYHTHVRITPPVLPDAEQQRSWLEWHQDSARVNLEMQTQPRPRLSLKVAYFLTDVSQPDRGNFYVLPGSHLSSTVPLCSEVGRDPQEAIPDRVPDEAMPICVEPGDAVLFDRRLWHSRSPNDSTLTRKALFYGYSYRWLRPRDNMTVDHIIDDCEPIRRQLLGASANGGFGYTSPKDDDVPLKLWLIEHLGSDEVPD